MTNVSETSSAPADSPAIKKARLSRFVFFLFVGGHFVLTSSLPRDSSAESGMTKNLPVLYRAATQLAADLNRQFKFSGHAIQVSENNFWQQGTQLNLPLSAPLSDALAFEVSSLGGTVTVQEVGREPLRLVGAYGMEGIHLVITARIRIMGEAASRDVAVARTEVPGSSLDRTWLKPEFDRVARTLVRLLELNYYGSGRVRLEIAPLQPGLTDQQALLLGEEFGKFLEAALSDSPVFGKKGFGPGSLPLWMEGTYATVENRMRFRVELLDSRDRAVTSAAFDVALADIPLHLLKPTSERAFAGKGTASISRQCRSHEKPCPPRSELLRRAERVARLFAMRALCEQLGVQASTLSRVASGRLEADEVKTSSHGTLRKLQFLEPVIEGDQVCIALIAEVNPF